MKAIIKYKNKFYDYNYNHNFNNFMSTEIFRVLIKDIRESKNNDNLSISIDRDIEPVYILGEFCGMKDNGTYLTINGDPVEGIPDWCIMGLMNYVNKYVITKWW